MNSDDYYEILEIPESANQREIKIAYRRLARKYHPDRNSKVSDDLMKNINIAFETLSDLQKRKEYDKKLKKIDSKINEGGFGNNLIILIKLTLNGIQIRLHLHIQIRSMTNIIFPKSMLVLKIITITTITRLSIQMKFRNYKIKTLAYS